MAPERQHQYLIRVDPRAPENIGDPPKHDGADRRSQQTVDVTMPTAIADGCHSALRIDMTTPIMKRSYASVRKPMPAMNMTFQCSRVTRDGSRYTRSSLPGIVDDMRCSIHQWLKNASALRGFRDEFATRDESAVTA
jgi:hypothetical protein